MLCVTHGITPGITPIALHKWITTLTLCNTGPQALCGFAVESESDDIVIDDTSALRDDDTLVLIVGTGETNSLREARRTRPSPPCVDAASHRPRPARVTGLYARARASRFASRQPELARPGGAVMTRGADTHLFNLDFFNLVFCLWRRGWDSQPCY